ncbi:MAG: ISNCY family transposase, partial [Phycisphaeraceae bacterium]|nr:ISNCY family transposase [Phycisphaeraceae bacterium]
MRIKSSQQYFDFSEPSSLKIVKEYRQKYQKISDLLDQNPRILSLAHKDWAKLLSSSRKGRSGFSSEQLLRGLLVMFQEQKGYRGTVILIETSDVLRHFARMAPTKTMDFTFLNKAYNALEASTVEQMVGILADFARSNKLISGKKQRMDTTAYETNIHYPTDSSLLWDSFRTLSRLLRTVLKDQPQLELYHRFHDKKIKKMATYIARNASSKRKTTQRKVKRQYAQLIQRVRWIHGVAQVVYDKASQTNYDVTALGHYLPLVKKIVDQADKRILKGINVPRDEKLYSLFESHTELIVRGKAGKPIEFGHKILIAQTAEKYIHHYKVMEKQIEDKDLLVPAIDAHKDLFGCYPQVLTTDKGFYESMQQIAELEGKIPVVSIAKKGRRTQAELERETSEAFIDGQRFRAGSEGSISVLKRAFKLGRCLFKGFKNYAASVGFAVLCHNLVLLTKL